MKKLMTYLFVFLSLISLFLTNSRLSAQNLTDVQGRKTGHWIVTYENGKIQYEADFAEGLPVGLMTRYNKNGELAARMYFSDKGKHCRATQFYPGSKIAAEGNYINREKDSIWNYYAEEDGSLRITENWKTGKMDGEVCRYYPNGQLREKTIWKDGKRNGSWEQFFENGSTQLTGGFVNDLRNGPYVAYFPDGTLELEGAYTNELFDGTWKLYNEEGELVLTLHYINGILQNKDDLGVRDEELLKKIEENTGNMPHPALGGF